MLCLLHAAFVWFRNLDKLIHHVNKVCQPVPFQLLMTMVTFGIFDRIRYAGRTCQRVLFDARTVCRSKEGIQRQLAPPDRGFVSIR